MKGVSSKERLLINKSVISLISGHLRASLVTLQERGWKETQGTTPDKNKQTNTQKLTVPHAI